MEPRIVSGRYSENRAVTACSALFILLALGAAVFFSLRLPVYADEVTWSVFSHRGIMDHYAMILAYPQCGERAFSQPLPFLWVIPAWVNHLLYDRADHVLDLRIAGLFRFFLWLLLWVWVLRRLLRLRFSQCLAAGAMMLAFFATDHVFLLLLLARPEQAEILAASLAIALSVYAPACIGRPLWATAGVCLFIGFTNPREIVLLPLFALAAFRIAGVTCRSPAWRYLFSGAVCAILSYSYILWLGRFDCPDSDIVRSFWGRETFPFHLALEDPAGFWPKALRRFRSAVMHDLSASGADYWLGVPPDRSIGNHVYFVMTALLPRVIALCLVTWYASRQFILDGVNRRWGKGYFVLAQSTPLALCLLLALFALLAFQGEAHAFYSAALDVPLLLMAGILAFHARLRAWQRHPCAYAAFFALLGCGTVNLLHMLFLYPHPERYGSVIPNRVISFSMQDFDNRSPALPALAKACDIDAPSAKHLVLDILTYFPFRRSFEPYDMYFATDQVADFNKTALHFDPEKFMRVLDRNQSGGIIADCRDFPDSMRPYATERNGFCCVSRQTIHAIGGDVR
jgi:hypothetical protein